MLHFFLDEVIHQVCEQALDGVSAQACLLGSLSPLCQHGLEALRGAYCGGRCFELCCGKHVCVTLADQADHGAVKQVYLGADLLHAGTLLG
jgi:hypothetical protein